jgi:hypothetical protein
LVNFSGVRIEIVGTIDALGTKHLVQNEAAVFVSRMLDGSQRHGTQTVMEGDGVGLAIGLGTSRPLASPVTPVQTEVTEHLASIRGSGKKNRFALTVTGTQERKKVVLLETRSITLCPSTKTLL